MMNEPAAAAEARLSPTPLRGWPQRLLHLAALAVGCGEKADPNAYVNAPEVKSPVSAEQSMPPWPLPPNR